MKPSSVLGVGGLIASGILILMGIASSVVGYLGIEDVRDTLASENIVGSNDSPIAGQLVDTGDEAKVQASTIRKHTLESTGGLTYAETGRFASAAGDPKGTNDQSQAVLNDQGSPVPNPARERWVQATALSTALNTAYFAERVGYFAILVGVAMVLAGIGFIVLTFGTLLHVKRRSLHLNPAWEAQPTQRPQPAGG